MIYEDYRKAALKHLKTCEFMIDNLKNIDTNDTLDNLSKIERKNYILRDIYYLCGYIIEGVVNYCIYKNINTYRQNPNGDVNNLNENISSINSRVSFFGRRNNPRLYIISSHQYAKNIEVLKHMFSQRFNRIPIINQRRNSQDKISVMFYDWNVNMRYQTDNTNFTTTNLSYDENDIIDYFIFVRDDIYIKLPLL